MNYNMFTIQKQISGRPEKPFDRALRPYETGAKMDFTLGSIVETKKQHPCGSRRWRIIRTGADFKIRCEGCGRIVMLSYEDFRKRVKKVISSDEKENG